MLSVWNKLIFCRLAMLSNNWVATCEKGHSDTCVNCHGLGSACTVRAG